MQVVTASSSSQPSSPITSTTKMLEKTELELFRDSLNLTTLIESQINSLINTKAPEVPIGTIVAWVFKVSSSSASKWDLPDGWVRCDGGVIPSRSIWAGQRTPNINGERRFLRGGPPSNMLKTEEDQIQDHKHDIIDMDHLHSFTDKYPSRLLFLTIHIQRIMGIIIIIRLGFIYRLG